MGVILAQDTGIGKAQTGKEQPGKGKPRKGKEYLFLKFGPTSRASLQECVGKS